MITALFIAVLVMYLGRKLYAARNTKHVEPVRAKLAKLLSRRMVVVTGMVLVIIVFAAPVIFALLGHYDIAAMIDCFLSVTMFAVSFWVAIQDNELEDDPWTKASVLCMLCIAGLKIGTLVASFFGICQAKATMASNIFYSVPSVLIPYARSVYGEPAVAREEVQARDG